MADKNDIRLQIITLHDNTTKSTRESASNLGVSQSMVAKTIQQYKERGTHQTDYSKCGRPQHFDDRDLRHFKNVCVCVKSPRLSAVNLHASLTASGDTCSYSTVKRALVKAGCKAIKAYRRPNLTAAEANKRLEWALQHRHWTVEQWKNVVFSDETQIQLLDNCLRYICK